MNIAKDGDEVYLKAINKATQLNVSKIDIYGSELKGALMQITDTDGKVFAEWTSNGNTRCITNIPAGSYVLKETASPDGYVIASQISFTIDRYPHLESALSYLEDYLAPYGEYKISNISLEYCSKDNGDNGNSFTYHPTWCFTINKYQTNVYQLEPKRVLYLDAINKEVFCWDDVQFEFIFGDNTKNNMNQ